MLKHTLPALKLMVLFTVVTGMLYPGVVTGVCQLLFPRQADGSLATVKGQLVGSTLIGQNFQQPKYFHPRPSAAGNNGYDPTASGGSNYGPTNQKLYDRVKASVEQYRKENPDFKGDIPADAVTASASGLDPDISVENAMAQSSRVAKARGLQPQAVESLIKTNTQQRDLGVLGEPRVNVLALNLALDRQSR